MSESAQVQSASVSPNSPAAPGSRSGRADPSASLAERFPGLVCDLDGVVYRGAQAVPHAVDSLDAAIAAGARVVYATNNASRPPAVVADTLRGLGLAAGADDVLTSSIAGARTVAARLSAGATVLAIGGAGVADALTAAGLRVVRPTEVRALAGAEDDARTSEDAPVGAVLQGYGPEVTAADLAEAAYAIQGGATWVVTNDDLTLPTDRGVAPGNGSLVGAVRVAVGVDPVVVGKPGPLLYELAAETLGTDPEHTLGIGDRLETDIAGAHAAGMSALHVLTGVHGPAELVRAEPALRPRFVAADLRALGAPYIEPSRRLDGSWMVGDQVATGRGSGAEFAVRFDGGAAADDWIVRLRLALCILWEAQDAGKLSGDEAVAALPERR
ncbi:HAD-IIA family hydrolase [Flexivirga caeni]|uniref:HAD-IIA family hydrolase n=1 Tax=Flexivirga caeni TaxID=2294115 RepID=UPI001FE3D05D|nr:HAD-IIA family hydrolase [Flexivirga caeni]